MGLRDALRRRYYRFLDDEDRAFVHALLGRHLEHTGSTVAERILTGWVTQVSSFRKVMPRDYKRVLTVLAEADAAGLPEDERLAKVMAVAHG